MRGVIVSMMVTMPMMVIVAMVMTVTASGQQKRAQQIDREANHGDQCGRAERHGRGRDQPTHGLSCDAQGDDAEDER